MLWVHSVTSEYDQIWLNILDDVFDHGLGPNVVSWDACVHQVSELRDSEFVIGVHLKTMGVDFGLT